MEAKGASQNSESKKRKAKTHWKDKQWQKKKAKKDKDKPKKDRDMEDDEWDENYEELVSQIGSPKFDEYYKVKTSLSMQRQLAFLSSAEFQQCKEKLTEKLAVTFRVNQSFFNYERTAEMFKDKQFISKNLIPFEDDPKLVHAKIKDLMSQAAPHSFTAQIAEEGKELQEVKGFRTIVLDYENLKIEGKKFYQPGDLVYELSVSKDVLKKNFVLKGIHKLIQQCNDAGLVTRQEIVSMLPPLLLDLHYSHWVFDMCAAPGSKTSQIIELMHSSLEQELGALGQDGDEVLNQMKKERQKGLVIANDADHKRAYMLTHQLNRLNTSSKFLVQSIVDLVILNHNAQNFPFLYDKTSAPSKKGALPNSFDSTIFYDRILCDVPCSSDAAIRKIPQKWEKWSTKDGSSLHPLQIQILKKGLQLLKVGGKLSYSTCSLNPIENEAVVAAALKAFEGYIELVDVKKEEIGQMFQFRDGLNAWEVLVDQQNAKDSYFQHYPSFSQVPEAMQGSSIRETMFTSFYDERVLKELSKCLRVLPQDQNTSGFFITIIRKVKDFDQPLGKDQQEEEQKKGGEKEEERKVEADKLPLVIQEKSIQKNFSFVRCDPNDPDVQYIKAYYGLGEDFPPHQLVTQSDDMKKLFFVSKAVSDFLYSDCFTHNLSIINMGVGMFHRNQSRSGGSSMECIFRIDQDGAATLAPFMTKRIIWTTDPAIFKVFFMTKTLKVALIEDESVRGQCEELNTGCFIVALKGKTGQVEAVTLHKTGNQMNLMATRQSLYSLHFRFLSEKERDECKDVLT